MTHVLALVAALLSAPAGTSCVPVIADLDITAVEYNPFVPASPVLEARVSLDNPGPEACPIVLALAGAEDGQVATQGGEVLRGTIRGPGSTGVNGFARDLLLQPGRSDVVFTFDVPAGQVVSPGLYTRLYTARLLDALGGLLDPSGERVEEMGIAVAPRAEIGIAGGPSASEMSPITRGEIDFGTLSEGRTGAAYLQIRANTQVRVIVSSFNRGVLRRQGAPAGVSGTEISYRASLDGETLDLGGAGQEISRRPRMGLSGSVYTLSVTIGETRGRFAGHYRDTIEFLVSAD